MILEQEGEEEETPTTGKGLHLLTDGVRSRALHYLNERTELRNERSLNIFQNKPAALLISRAQPSRIAACNYKVRTMFVGRSRCAMRFTKLFCNICFKEIPLDVIYFRKRNKTMSRYYHENCAQRVHYY